MDEPLGDEQSHATCQQDSSPRSHRITALVRRRTRSAAWADRIAPFGSLAGCGAQEKAVNSMPTSTTKEAPVAEGPINVCRSRTEHLVGD